MECRICGGELISVCEFNNIPNAAQHLPASKEEALLNKISLNLCSCIACGLVQHTGAPVSYYRDVIRATAYSDEMKSFRKQQLSDIAVRYGLCGKEVLEIGCGKGEYLSLLNKSGMSALGTESGKDNILCCKQSGNKVYDGYFGDASFAQSLNTRFNGFFSFNYFEHLPDLRNVLINVRKCIKDNAVGIVEVPNFDMMLKKNMLSEIIPDHIFYFTSETLRNTLSISGFTVVRCEEIWHDYILHAEVIPKSIIDLVSFNEYTNELNSSIRQFVSDYSGKRLAVWGAGHQSMLALSLCNKDILKSIKFVVDSASFKQGKFLPVSGLQIVPPQELTTGEIDAVIIIAAGYSQEIASSIKAISGGIAVAILENTTLKYVN